MSARNGAEQLVATAVEAGVSVCFANPGTTEMPLVAALDAVPGMRSVLGLFEGVCTGAADGYARMSGRPAMTILHLGPGLANGIANLHNARRARTPIVNVVGDHASWHLEYDAPLTSDIDALAGTVSRWVGTVDGPDTVAAMTAQAVRESLADGGGGATLIVPVDFQQLPVADSARSGASAPAAGSRPASDGVATTAERLRQARRAAVLLGGNALTRAGQEAAGRLAASRPGVVLFSDTFPARTERGGGLVDIPRLPYFPERAIAALADCDVVVLAGLDEPVAYFGYEGIPSLLAPAGTIVQLAGPHERADEALVALAEALGATTTPEPLPQHTAVPAEGPLTGVSAATVVVRALPPDAIVSVEGGTCGYPFFDADPYAPAHTVLTNTGGAIGQGLPCALGAAIAEPDRPVIALQSDGSGLYTVQSLWTMARERTDVTVLITANHTYNVLRTELDRHDVDQGGSAAEALTSLARPNLDWVELATGFGVPASRAHTTTELHAQLERALAEPGPHLIEMSMSAPTVK